MFRKTSMPKNESPSEEEVKRAAEIKEWLESRILELETELARLRNMEMLVDTALRRTSFVSATELRRVQSSEAPLQTEKNTRTESQSVGVTSDLPRQLRRAKDGFLIANAFVSEHQIAVVPSSDVRISQTTPPFQTFFVNRILKGYESKDQELVATGKLKTSEALSYQIEEKDGYINKVVISNYKDKSRLNEILSTINWAFTRMLEKK